MTSSTDEDMSALVRDADLELCSLSGEEFQALWAYERLQIDPGSTELMMAALRSLVAADLASVDADGELALGPATSLIRRVYTNPGTSIVWQHDRDEQRPVRTWSIIASDTILEQIYEMPGVHRFAVRRLRRALTQVLEQAVPASAKSAAGRGGVKSDLEPEAITELPPGLDHLTKIRVLRVLAETSGDQGVNYERIDLALVSDGQSRCALLTPGPGETTTLIEVSLKDAYRHLWRLVGDPLQDSGDQGKSAV